MMLRNRAGFNLVEILVVIAIISILSFIAFQAYAVYIAKERDDQRMLHLNRFAQQLENYRTQKGAYVCGDLCQNITGGTFTVDCSDAAVSPNGSAAEKEIVGFLNGGTCCSGTPSATSTLDDASWGLYRYGYLESPALKDPIEQTIDGKQFTYCYAAPANGRNSYALFTRLQRSDKGVTDNGTCDNWYELRSTGYPVDGWTPNGCNGAGGPVCGDGIKNGTEQCDGTDLGGQTCVTRGFAGGTLSCNSSCQFVTTACTFCGDGITQMAQGETCDTTPPGDLVPPPAPGGRYCRVGATVPSGCTFCGDGIRQVAFEQCDDGNSNGLDTCSNACTRNAYCGNGICEAGETGLNCPNDCYLEF